MAVRFSSAFVVVTTVLALAVLWLDWIETSFEVKETSVLRKDETRGGVIRQTITDGVVLTLEMGGTETNSESQRISLGPHKAYLNAKECPNPRIWLRLTGDALVAIPLTQDTPEEWSGPFTIPISGSYLLEARWYGCGDANTTYFLGLSSPVEFQAVGSGTNGTAWISSTRIPTLPSPAPSYIWMNYTTEGPSNITTTFLPTQSSMGNSLISRETTPVSNGIQALSNYEIVCWIGSESAISIHNAFMSLRPAMAPNQRPFKFHLHVTKEFVRPEKYEGFLKCKNVLVSIDALNYPISQLEYKEQIGTFVNHIVKALNDTTFPIWIATVNLPAMNTSTLCHSPPKPTLEHPCNDALHQLFLEDAFPDHVHLMDNTDLTAPQFGERMEDVLAVVAMRCFARVAHQVDVWRGKGQIGRKDGLHRGGVVEPNPTGRGVYQWT